MWIIKFPPVINNTYIRVTMKINKLIIAFFFLIICLTVNAQTIDVYSRPVKEEPDRSFDAINYRIELDIDMEGKKLSGQNTITLSPLNDKLETVILDAVSLVVTNAVDDKGRELDYNQTENKLIISLNEAISYRDTIDITVKYYLTEQVLGLRFIDASDKSPKQVSSDCFPNKARQWIPCYDYPHDKFTQEMNITVDKKYKVLSNGSLMSITDNNKKHTYHWKQDKPHSTYLISLSIADYAVIKDSLGSLPINYWVYQWNVEDAKRSFAKTPYMIDFYNKLYDYEFPWAKYDQVISAYMGGGAEATSATLLSQAAVTDKKAVIDFSYEWIIAHEIAHQWWGDLITCRSWEHTWMNESFGTYSDHMYKRYAWGEDEGAYDLINKKNDYLREAHNKYMRPIVFNRYDSPGQNFDKHTYPKGACVLHMLRFTLGDETFFRALSTFLHRHEFQPVTTQDFMKCVKDVSGKNMDWFFNQFLFYPGHAVFEVNKKWDKTSGTLTVEVMQTQDKWDNVPIYHIPVNIGLYSTDGGIVKKVWIKDKKETFEFKLDSEPLMVRFDDGNHLLKEWTFKKSEKELIYQAKNDDMTGRLWAVDELKTSSESKKTIEVWSDIAKNDNFWAVRELALRNLSKYHNSDFTDLFMSALEDQNSKVRVAAISALGDNGDKKNMERFKSIFNTDDSYLVMAEAIKSIGKCGSKSQLKFLRKAATTESNRNVINRAAEEAIKMINNTQ